METGHDCGIFVCMFADIIANEFLVSFGQAEIDVCRQRIAVAIMRGIVNDPCVENSI